MYSMSCAPFTCCSIDAATDCETTSAFAPGKTAFTVTWGGTTCGYCAIGRLRPANAPTRIMRRAITVEKTGRSMKKLSMARALRLRGHEDRLYSCAGPNLADPLHHDPVSGRESARDHPVGAEKMARDNLPRLDLVAGADHIHRLRPLQLLHGLLRNANRALTIERRHDDAHEQARAQEAIGIGHGHAHLQRSTLRVDRGVDEIEAAGHLVVAAVREPDVKRRALVRPLPRPLPPE